MAYQRKRRSRFRSRKESSEDLLIIGVVSFAVIVGISNALKDLIDQHLVGILLFAVGLGILCLGAFFLIRLANRSAQENYFLRQDTLEALQALDPWVFEEYLEWVFQKIGYTARVGKGRGDHGIDLELWKGDKKYAVQAKKYGSSRLVGEPDIRDFYGSFAKFYDAGIFITTSKFTQQARDWASEYPIELWDAERLLDVVTPLKDSKLQELMFGNMVVIKNRKSNIDENML